MSTDQINTSLFSKFLNQLRAYIKSDYSNNKNITFYTFIYLYSRDTPTGIPRISFIRLGKTLYNMSKNNKNNNI